VRRTRILREHLHMAPHGTVGDIEPLNGHDVDFENRGRLVRAELGDTRLHLLPAFSPPKASLV
jgi:hypothetical protein